MEYRNLGSTGTKVSVVGIGCNNFGAKNDASQTQLIVDAAVDAGINLFDTADVYGGAGKSEEFLGRALQGKRQDVVVATKFGAPMGEGPHMHGASRSYIFRAVEASLKRLGTDYIDLYQLHVPDGSTPPEETLAALDDLVTQGKVRYLGSSNFAGWQIADAEWIARTRNLNRFVTAQNQYSLLDRRIEREVVPACNKFHKSITESLVSNPSLHLQYNMRACPGWLSGIQLSGIHSRPLKDLLDAKSCCYSNLPFTDGVFKLYGVKKAWLVKEPVFKIRA